MPPQRFTPLVVGRTLGEELTLLAVSDLHRHDVAILVDAVGHFKPDIVVFAGDGLHDCAQRAGDDWLRAIGDSVSVGVFAVAGNADGRNALQRYGGPKVYDLAKRPVDVGSIRFVGLEGAPIIDGLPRSGLGDPLYREVDAERHLARSIRGHAGPVVLVSHAPPRGILDHSFRLALDVGSTAVSRFVSSGKVDVRLVICGHVHARGGLEDTSHGCPVHNVASQQDDDGAIRICHVRLTHASKASAAVRPANPFGASLRWTKFGEIGFLAGMPRPVAADLVANGVTRIVELAQLTGDRLSQCIGWKPEKAVVWALRAQSFLDGRPVPRDPLGIPALPRWYIDIETDPWGGRKNVWAIAITSHDTGVTSQWYLTNLSGQRGMLRAVARALAELPVGKLIAYSGSRFDERILAEHMRRHGISVPASLETAIDLHPAIARAVALPGTGQLKPVLKAFAIVHRDGDLDGLEVASRAMHALDNNKPIPARMLRYNREDARTLRALATAVMEMTGSRAPLPRRARPSGGAVRKAQDEKRVAELLLARGLTVAELARINVAVAFRIQAGMRVTSTIVERALSQLDSDDPVWIPPGA